jgi:hypothetical protein
LTPAELHKIVFASLGPKVGLAAREACLPLLKGGRQVSLRYDWVATWEALSRLVMVDGVELDDGAEWFRLSLSGND